MATWIEVWQDAMVIDLRMTNQASIHETFFS